MLARVTAARVFGSETDFWGRSVCHRRKGTTESVRWFVLVTNDAKACRMNGAASGVQARLVCCAPGTTSARVRSLFSAHVSLLIPQISDGAFV